MVNVAIIAALEREIRPLVGMPGWRKTNLLASTYGCYQSNDAMICCAGIGGAHARRAAEEVVRTARPAVLVSAGVAGALVPRLKAGQVVVPGSIIDSTTRETFAKTGKFNIPASVEDGVLVSASGVVGKDAKQLLARELQATAVDMEAASVAAVAKANGIPFLAIKAISEELEFPMPNFGAFVNPRGRLRTGALLLHAAVRPGMWPVLARLASNTSRASRELCRVLNWLLDSGDPAQHVQSSDSGLVFRRAENR